MVLYHKVFRLLFGSCIGSRFCNHSGEHLPYVDISLLCQVNLITLASSTETTGIQCNKPNLNYSKLDQSTQTLKHLLGIKHRLKHGVFWQSNDRVDQWRMWITGHSKKVLRVQVLLHKGCHNYGRLFNVNHHRSCSFFYAVTVHGSFVDQSVILDSEKLHLGEDLFVEKLFLWQQMSAQY